MCDYSSFKLSIWTFIANAIHLSHVTSQLMYQNLKFPKTQKNVFPCFKNYILKITKILINLSDH